MPSDFETQVRDKPEQCDSCGFRTAELESYRTHRYGLDEYTKDSWVQWVCYLCGGTLVSTWYEYHNENHALGALICYVGNIILAELRGEKT